MTNNKNINLIIEESHSEYEIETLTSFQDVERFRIFWQSVRKHPNSDIDFYLSILCSRNNIIRPHVLVLKHFGKPISLLIGRIEHYRFSLNFGYNSLYKSDILALVLIYQGLLGDASETACARFYSEIITFLSSGDIGLVLMSSLRTDGLFYDLVQKRTNSFFRDNIPVSNMHWAMSIPHSIDEFYAMRSRKHRYWLRRISKILDKDSHGNICFKTFLKKEEVATLCHDVEEVAKHTYHRGIGAGFIDGKQERDILEYRAEKEALRGYVLYINNDPVAFWIGIQYLNTFYLAYTGYLPQYEKYELGTILFLKLVEDIISCKTIHTIDFGFGDAAYKRRFGDTSWEEISIYLFPHTLKGFTLNAARTCFALTYKLSIRVLERLNLLEKVKKFWRRKLSTAMVNEPDSKERH